MIKAIGSAALAITSSGCGCTEMGCGSVLEVNVTSEPSLVREAEVTLASSETIRCKLGDATARCSVVRRPDGTLTFRFVGEPASMQLVRLFDSMGQLLAERMFSPTIDIERPNGEGCPPTCKSATLQF